MSEHQTIASAETWRWVAPVAGAVFGAITFVARADAMPWWQRIVLLVSSAAGAALAGTGAGEYLHISPGLTGVLAYLTGVLMLPLTQSMIALVSDLPWLRALIERRLGVDLNKPR
ncbi:hypothetical protein [Jeongeupia naejangsanensis]|uniref:Holin n=1 Tax=Jeongeupia naejangsanensis TaxID=613195 RepID=A0ABS2BHD0_9NEIS|nr:hypothetical protein [Jeongeupia naejangsanensis]MBM3115006.1 hypothetical protein [Jeongeupia naejangsanensis]